MDDVLAFLIFIVLSAACWLVSVALYQATAGGPDPAAGPNYRRTAAVAVGAAALTSFVPFPAGYLAGLIVWAAAAFAFLGLPAGRAAILRAEGAWLLLM